MTRHRAKNQSYSKKAIREVKRDKNTQKVFLNPKEKKFKQCLQRSLTRECYNQISLCAFLQFP
ncbi:hypothetical protein EWZ95_04835 [Helicobacter pylori]|nr:hypothetical protein [Helicobacter pylori]QEF24657.1 hypothetical protein D2C85_08130 [Helicobacter pylori]